MAEKNNQLNVFKTVAEFSSDWLMWLAANHTIKYISPAVETITGYAPQEFIEDPNLFKQLIHPEDKEYILQEFEDELNKSHACSTQFRIIHKNGSVRWVAHRCRPVFDDHKKIIGRVSSNRDITSTKLAESALKEKERFLQSIIDGIQDPMHVIDRDYKVLLTNKKLLEMKNVTQQAIRGKLCYKVYQGRDTHCEQCAAKEVFETGKPHSLIKTLPLPDGSERYFEVYAFPLFEENDEVTQVIEITRDITKHKELENSLRKQEELLRTLINSTPDIICFKDGQGRWLEANEADLKLFQLENVDYRGKKDSELAQYSAFYYDAFMTCEASDEITWEKGVLSRGIEIIPRPDGSEKVYDIIKVPLFEENGSRKGLVVLGRDITEMKQVEKILKQSEDRLSKIMLASNDGMWDWNLINNEVYFDPRYYEMAGYSVDEFPHTLEEFQKRVHPDYLDMVMNQAQMHLNGEIDRFNVEFPFKKKDGQWMWILGRGVIVERDEKGIPLRFVGTHTDITDRRKASEALRESEEKYRKISLLYRRMADNIPDLVWAKDLEGKFLFTNKSICENLLMAKDVNEPIGKDDLFFAKRQRAQKPDQKDWFTFGELCVNSDEIVIKTKKPQRFDEFGNVQGKFLYLDVYKAPIWDENGKMIGTVGHGRIVTKEREIEKKLIQSEEKYRRIFEESQDVVFVSSADGKFLDINPAGLQLFGYSSLDEIRKVDIAKELYKNPQDRRKYQQRLRENGFIKDYELQLKRKDGTELIVVENSTAIYDPDRNVIACRGIMRDITEKKNLEDQLAQAQKMESIGTLAGGVAHDFNNLLTVINGYAEIALLHMEANDPLHKDILSILKAGKRAENLTSQLLAFSRKQIFKPEILDINQVISSMDKMLRRLIDEDINIETVFADHLPDIKADNSQLEQIFVNLVVNARDALRAVKKPDFQKKITIETGQTFLSKGYVAKHPGSRQGRQIFFAVSDNGVGMDEQTKQKVFEPFFTTKAKYKGTGLGLSMVYGIVKQNNGSVYVYSEPGEGTMFKIYWPATEEKDQTEKATVSDEILYGNETLLIVEDEEEVCRFTSEALTSLGYTVYKADNGRLALELIKKESLKPDLIVTDLIMPELNGKEFIEKVCKFYPDVKVIYVSGYTDNHIVHNGMLEEGVHFIHKPYSVKTLAATVRQVLDEV